MRNIGSKRREVKKQKRNQLIVGIVLTVILFGSIFGYALGGGGGDEKSNIITYKGYEFVEENGFWFTEIGNFEFSFRYNPNETEQIDSNLNLLESYYNKPLYISSENEESTNEIYRNLVYQNSLVQRMQPACLEGEECANDELAVKTCENNFIIIKEADTTNISQEDNCVFISGEAEDLTKITDGFLLKIIGVN